ncbi:hypothetical protein [Oceanibaculum pacificum]|uniref:Phasin domain-containing protein n=1 Tax=Oceanibaculum pacificum TaxID=580166 RepID=A0A154WBQ3_9PROT|nr:hypothetical protein [Oceanibaculum pacificum]KZD10939.1 hypothetical protein AUP43_18225 [Oceanibaculum pacificum]
MPLSAEDIKELNYSLQRMNGVAAVFRMRADVAMNPRFAAFADLIDSYVDCCQRSLTQGRDFIRDGLVITEEFRVEMTDTLNKIIEGDAGGAAVKPEEKK